MTEKWNGLSTGMTSGVGVKLGGALCEMVVARRATAAWVCCSVGVRIEIEDRAVDSGCTVDEETAVVPGALTAKVTPMVTGIVDSGRFAGAPPCNATNSEMAKMAMLATSRHASSTMVLLLMRATPRCSRRGSGPL